MSTRLYHVTSEENLASILDSGLLVDSPVKNFAFCARKVYVTTSLVHAHRWAREIAREKGDAHAFIMLSFEYDETYSVHDTEISTPQVTLNHDIEAERLTVHYSFSTFPQSNIWRLITNNPDGSYYCTQCERVLYATNLGDHLEEYHEDDDTDEVFAQDVKTRWS